MPRLRVAKPVWLAGHTKHADSNYPRLETSQRTQVAIIGGGITGASVAWTFAKAGIDVLVLESSRVGHGSTSASTALLMQEPDKDFTELRRWYGREKARRIWRLSMEATRAFIRTLRSLRIDCQLEARESVYYALSPDAGRRLRHELAERQRASIPGQWLERPALKALAGLDGAGAIRTAGNAQVNPRLACSGLMRAAKRRGARIFEDSPVERIEVGDGGATLIVNGHSVFCDRVVIATGYATPFFQPLTARLRMLNTYVLATQTIPAAARRELGLADVMLWDTARPYHYARWTRDHRLLLGGGDRPRVPDRQRRRALGEGSDRVWTYFVRRYPALADVDVEFAWEGLFATTPDGLPYIGPHTDYPRHLFALGYGGNGITFGFLAARMLLEQHRGRRSSDHALFAFDRSRR